MNGNIIDGIDTTPMISLQTALYVLLGVLIIVGIATVLYDMHIAKQTQRSPSNDTAMSDGRKEYYYNATKRYYDDNRGA